MISCVNIISAFGDPLYRINSKGLLQPILARELPKISDNGLRVDIHLRENVFFHDGTKFTAESMAFSLRRFMKIGTQSYVIGARIKLIETPSKYLLRLRLNRPSRLLDY